MGCLYHFGHFFELMAGIYFGGIALLSFMERGASGNAYSKLATKIKQSNRTKTYTDEFFRMKFKAKSDVDLNLLWNNFRWYFFSKLQKLFTWIFNKAKKRIEIISTNRESKILQKQFIPSFIYSGVFCLLLLIISPMQIDNKESPGCHNGADNFMIYFLLSSFIFQLWALFIFPLFVNKVDYFHLLFINLLITTIIVIFCFCGMWFNFFFALTSWLLESHNQSYLRLFVILTILLPIIFIFIGSIIIYLLWEIPILFTKLISAIFKIKDFEDRIEGEIEELNT